VPEPVRAQLSDGKTILIQADIGKVERDVSRSDKESQFAEVLPSIVSLCKDFQNALDQVLPEKATLEFGISFRVETTGLVALLGKGSADTNVRVTLEWGKK
jgi:hypothetical protein